MAVNCKVLARVWLLFFLLSPSVMASDPEYPPVDFDLPVSIACSELSTSASNGKKFVEVEFELSVRVGHPADKLKSIHLDLMTIERTPSIVDYLPKEKFCDETCGPVEVVETENGQVEYTATGTIGATGTAAVVVPGGVVQGEANASVVLGREVKKGHTKITSPKNASEKDCCNHKWH